MATFLARYHDPALDPPLVGAAELEKRQVDRITNAMSVVIIAGTIPRRLGADATDEELAQDVKRARRTGWALKQALRGWTKKTPTLPLSDEVRMAGAQIVWATWVEAYIMIVQTELRICATWAIVNDQEIWGRRAVVKLENELNWITYALRD